MELIVVTMMGFPGCSVVKNLPAKAGFNPAGFNPWSGKVPHVLGQLSLDMATIETVPRAWELQLLKLSCLEPMSCSKRSHHGEKPAHRNWRVTSTCHN